MTAKRLEYEWNDGFSALGVILELLLVVSVLCESPNGHLEHSSAREQISWQALGHDGEREPGRELVGVVGAGDKVEESSKWVAIWYWDFAYVGAWGTQVSQQQVDRKITQLAQLKQQRIKLNTIL